MQRKWTHKTLKIPPLQNDLINAKGEGDGAQHMKSAQKLKGQRWQVNKLFKVTQF